LVNNLQVSFEKELEMDTPLDLDQLTHQTKRREFTDGLRDLHVGLMILILSLLVWFTLTPTGMTWLVKAVLYDKTLTMIGLIGFFGLFILIIFGAERLMERIRRASLWKESGFVKPLRWGFNKWITIAVAAVILAIVVGSVWLMAMGRLSQDVALRSIPASACFGMGVQFFGMGYSLKIRRHLAVGVAGSLLGVTIFLYPFSFAQAWLCFGLGWSVILLVSGAWALGLALSELKGGAAHE
jgi:hypothetical protein